MRRFAVVACILTIGLAVLVAHAQAPSFDKLSDEDRGVLAKRFEKEIWPLMQRGGKESCVNCHKGGQLTALRLTGNPTKDFPMLVKEGFFIPNDLGSLLGRITDLDPERRMPPGKAKPWSATDIKLLSAFVADLDKKQKK